MQESSSEKRLRLRAFFINLFLMNMPSFLRRFFFILPVFLGLGLAGCSDTDNSVGEKNTGGVPAIYRDYSEVTQFLSQVHEAYPTITAIEPVGTSVEGRDIQALVISDNPGDIEAEPRVRLTGTIHGSEFISGEILFRFIDYLTTQYAADDTVKNLVDSRYIVIIPVMNPDGLQAGTRQNANDVDLNRNFILGASSFTQNESQAMRLYSLDKKFNISVTYHSGTVVVNTLFDYAGEKRNGIVPGEYDLVKSLGRIYADAGFKNSNGIMTTEDDEDVVDGVINGGDWYIANGTLQDWSYLEAGCIDYTVEVARSSPLTEEGINNVFLYNRDSMLALIEAAGMGVSGHVTEADGITPLEGVAVKNVTSGSETDLVTYTDSKGYFHRVLKDGSNYKLQFSLGGYEVQEITGTAPKTITDNIILSQ
jgi:carboxypeptidase D